MASGDEVPGQNPGRVGSEDLDRLKCQPCLEDGHLHEAVGMCVDCDDHLCEKCCQSHTIPKPLRHHQLLDKDEMRQGHIRASTKDMCTEKCQVHDDEITKYYCTKHRQLGSTLCITLDHKSCDNTRYIPLVAKDLANNEEYKQAESRMKYAMDIFNKVSENIAQNSEDLETSCAEAVESIKEFRRSIDEALSKIEAGLIEKVELLKSEEIKEMAEIRDKYKAVQEELQAAWTKIDSLINSHQNCSAYINMMKTQERLTDLQSLTQRAKGDASYKKRKIEFTPNRSILESLRMSDSLGTVSNYCSSNGIKRLKHDRDLNVKVGTDTFACFVTGLVILSGERLVLADRTNKKVKTVSVQSGQVVSYLQLSSMPWDVTAISSSKVAVTLPDEKKVAIITVGDSAISMEKNLDVEGAGYGVDNRNDKLAVSFRNPDKVQVLNLQGSVLHTLSSDNLGNPLFSNPYYLTYGQDDTTLYVSNFVGGHVVCVKLDGTVAAKYTYCELEKGPLQPVTDKNGNVLICAEGSCSSVHQITNDCKKNRFLLTKADGLGNPHSVCFNEKKDLIYVGRAQNDNIKVYSVERCTQ